MGIVSRMPALEGVPCSLTPADPVLQSQVTQKYLEHLISQRQYAETAKACAKLLKVSIAIMLPLQTANISVCTQSFETHLQSALA